MKRSLPNAAALKILVADDEQAIAELYARYMRDLGYRSATPVYYLENLVESIAAQSPDIVLLDLRFHNARLSFDLVPEIRKACLGVKIITNSSHLTSAYVQRATELGCEGIVWKASSLSELVEAVRVVASGERYLSPCINREGLRIVCTPLRPLNHHQRRLLALLQSGRTHAEIAKCLDITKDPCDDAVRRLRRNLQLPSEVTNWRLVALHDDAL